MKLFLFFCTICIDAFFSCLQAQQPAYFDKQNKLILESESRGDFKAALSYAEQAREKASAWGLDSLVLSYRDECASLFRVLGRYEESERERLDLLSIYEKKFGRQNPRYLSCLNNLASLYQDMGDFDRAEKAFLQTKFLAEVVLGRDNENYIDLLGNIGLLYSELGQYELAESFLTEAFGLMQSAGLPKDLNYARFSALLGFLYYNMKKWEQAERLYKETVSLVESLEGKHNPYYIYAINNLLAVYRDWGRNEAALPVALELLDVSGKVLGKTHPKYAVLSANAALLYMQIGQYDKAEPLLLESERLRRTGFPPFHPEQADIQQKLAELYNATGRQAQAAACLQKGLELLCRQPLSVQPTAAWADSISGVEWSSFVHLGHTLDLLRGLYQMDSIPDNRLLLTNLGLKLIRKAFDDFVDETDKLQLLDKTGVWVKMGLHATDPSNNPDRGLQMAEYNKAALLQQALRTERAYAFGWLPDSLTRERKQLVARHDSLRAALLHLNTPQESAGTADELNKIKTQIKAFDQIVKRDYPRFAQAGSLEQALSVDALRELLDEETALLEFAVCDSLVYIFCLQKQGAKAYVRFVSSSELSAKASALRRALTNYDLQKDDARFGIDDFAATAFWFYETLLAQALSEAGQGVNRLIIIPDGVLAHLPFEVFLTEPLPVAPDSYSKLPYLLRRYALSYNYSAALVAENQAFSARTNNGRLYALAADYTLSPDSLIRSRRQPFLNRLRDRLQELPAARQEVERLGESYQTHTALDQQAGERSFKTHASEYSILHLAVHGLLDNRNPLLSSLVLSEDGDSTEDNFLHAYEVSHLQLKSDMVVLSACETGYGRFETGNGTASLARAFMYAGVPALVVSLWEVNDLSTASIMENFYAGLARGLPKDRALRQAKLDYLQKNKGRGAHPAFWSAFVQIGNNQSIIPATKTGMAWMGWLAAAVLAATACCLWFLRRRL